MNLFREGNVTNLLLKLFSALGSLTDKDVINLTFLLQKYGGHIIAPFTFDSDGKVISNVISNAIANLKEMDFLREGTEGLSIIRGENIIVEDYILQTFKSIYNKYLENEIFPSIPPKIEKIRIGDSLLTYKSETQEVVNKFLITLPFLPEILVLFSINEDHPIFNKYLPLYSENSSEYVIFAPDSDVEIVPSTFKIFLKKIRNIVFHFFNKEFDNSRLTHALQIIIFNLLPLVSTTHQTVCTLNHRKETPFKYPSIFSRGFSDICQDNSCFSPIKLRGFILSDEKLFYAWKFGILMEGFIGHFLDHLEMFTVLWHGSLENKSFDVLAFNDEKVIIIECKRTSNYDKRFKKGREQLLDLRSFIIDECNIDNVKTVMWTTIQEPPKKDKEIDFIITQKNFVKALKNPQFILKAL